MTTIARPNREGSSRRLWLTERPLRACMTLGTTLVLAGCSLDGLLKSNDLPPNVTDPAVTQTPQGAMAAYNGTIAVFRVAFGGPNAFVVQSGILSDELQVPESGTALDRRLLPEDEEGGSAENSYRFLHLIRANAGQAIGLLNRYLPDQPVLAGHAYALEGYAELFLAELFCSGIPLSTVDYTADYTYRPGSSTTAVFTHAQALFDTALGLAGDSTRFVYLATLGKARALLALGDYAGAAALAATVPNTYRYEVSFTDAVGAGGINLGANFAAVKPGVPPYSMADFEGGNGLDYRTSGDPRTPSSQLTYTNGSDIHTWYHPAQYSQTGSSPMVVASGIEARLIQAEAALQAGDPSWLDTLNALRTDGTQDGGGAYNPGTGGVAGLAPLTDPGSASARVDLLFRERAFWLFLTGHRQGDLRRLIRQYGRTQQQVYPVGAYGNFPGALYGSDVTAPIPASEQVSNSLFTGCISRDA